MQDNGRKILRVAINVSLLLLIGLVFALSYLASNNSRKPSFNDSDLIYVRTEVPAVSNAYWTLLKATNGLYLPDTKKVNDLIANTNWDNALACEMLETNRACLNYFHEAMKQPSLLVPEMTNFDEDISYTTGWKGLSLVESIHIDSLHRAKKDVEAFDLALGLINFGQRVENCGGTETHYMVGAAIKGIGFARIQEMTADTTLSEADLVQLIRQLDNFGPNKEGLTNLLKVAYQADKKYFDNYAKGKLPDSTNSEIGQFVTSIAIKPLFSARKTKMEFAQADHFLLDNMSKPYSEINWSSLPGTATNVSNFDLLMSGNFIGSTFTDMIGWDSYHFIKTKSMEEVRVTATQLILALRVYTMRHGSLPDSLSDLVPEFFPQVPVDSFDGKPFRYLPEKKIIYSVGSSLKDLGGKIGDSAGESNMPFKIEF